MGVSETMKRADRQRTVAERWLGGFMQVSESISNKSVSVSILKKACLINTRLNGAELAWLALLVENELYISSIATNETQRSLISE